MNYTQEKKQIFIEKCKEHNLKITQQRQAIFFELIEDKTHPSAQTVYNRIKEQFPNISFDTVNRTLLSFVDIGLLEVIPVRGKAKRFDSTTREHGHFNCIKCHKLIDVTFQDGELKTPKSLQGNVVLNKKVIFEGICKDCK